MSAGSILVVGNEIWWTFGSLSSDVGVDDVDEESKCGSGSRYVFM